VAEFSAADVARLRKQTGAGMMDCKLALTETGGEFDAARDWLRAKGLAGATKRAGRAAEQGAVDVVVQGGVGAIAELTAETDFVAKGADFTKTVADLARLAVEAGTEELRALEYENGTVEDHVTQLAARLGENVALGRVVIFETSDGLIDGYRHNQNDRGTIGVLVELGGVNRDDDAARDVAHDVALHIASQAPQYATRDDVPADVVARERAVLEERTRNEGKPDAALPKIVEGRLNAFYKDTVLPEQAFVKDPKQTIAQVVGTLGPDAHVRRFARVKIGED
jgi:elongation factor Ts